MSFQFSDQHIESYYTHGFTVLRGILPPALVADLRRVTDAAREIARAEQGPQTQRLQPVSRYAIDQQPFEDFCNLPELNDAITRVLSPSGPPATAYQLGVMLGVLLEPADLPYCTPWHRDWRDNHNGLNLAQFDAVFTDTAYFNQINCALYEDGCTWVVPGSHLRPDLPQEIARFPGRPIPGPDLEGKPAAERERLCLEYCQSMPGAERLRLNAGDFALYRASLWHIGNYIPYCKRATLHDVLDTPEFAAWRETVLAESAARRAAGHVMDAPSYYANFVETTVERG